MAHVYAALGDPVRLRLLSLIATAGELCSCDMVEPLADKATFARVFLELGVLTWPNGLDVDSIALHDEMRGAGLLRKPAA